MNELNLQHPGFRARILNVKMDYSQLIVEYVIYRKNFAAVKKLYSRNSPIDTIQYWVDEVGEKINTLEEFDQIKFAGLREYSKYINFSQIN